MSPTPQAELIRATVFHTPTDPFALDPSDPSALVCHEDGGLLIEGGRIKACGDFEAIRSTSQAIDVIDWRGGFLVPGFVDTHVHFPQLRIIGSLGRTLLDWLEHVALPEEARMADTAYASETAALFTGALVSHGTTTALVFGSHYVAATRELFEAAGRSGLRIASGLVLSDRRLRPDLHHRPQDAYRESTDLIKHYHNRGRLKYAVTPRFALSTSESMLEVCGQLMVDHPDVKLQTHINENDGEIEETAHLFPWASDYLAIYEKYGLSGNRSVMAHNVLPSNSELERLAGARTSVAHCPCSNAALGSGMFPMRGHVDAGVRFALGTDVGGGLGFGLMKEALQAYLMQRIAPEPFSLTPAHLLYLATAAGATALGLDDVTGDFQPGKAADFVYLRPAENSVLDGVVRRAGSPSDVLGALFSMAGAETVREVRVEGAQVFRAEVE